MKNQKLKPLIHFLISVIISFAVIYLFVFFGGWKMLESNDPIQLEFVAALATGFIFWIIYEISSAFEVRLKELERRIEALEKRKKQNNCDTP